MFDTNIINFPIFKPEKKRDHKLKGKSLASDSRPTIPHSHPHYCNFVAYTLYTSLPPRPIVTQLFKGKNLINMGHQYIQL